MLDRNPHRGVTLLECLVVIAIIAVIVSLVVSSVMSARSAATRLSCQNRLRQLTLASQQFHQSQGQFPSGTEGNAADDFHPHLSWHVRLTPYLGLGTIWTDVQAAFRSDRFFLNDPPHRHRSEARPEFSCPADSRTNQPAIGRNTGRRHGLTSFLGVNGTEAGSDDGMLYYDSKSRITEVTDGTSQTLLLGERPPAGIGLRFGWWYAGWGTDRRGNADSHLGVRTRRMGSGAEGCSGPPFPFRQRSQSDPCSAFQFHSVHSGGANFGFVDGSVRFLAYSADSLLPALATKKGGETIDERP